MTWYLIAVSLHILAACVWIGGMVFLAAVLLCSNSRMASDGREV